MVPTASHATPAEIRQFGAPIVALFRTALGRDPDLPELARLVPLLRAHAELHTLAVPLVEAAEFAARHGAAAGAELANALCRDAFADHPERAGAARLGAALSADRAEIVAAVASAGLAAGVIPLLPALALGSPPDDPAAYALWAAEYDRADPAPPRSVSGPLITMVMSSGDTQAEAVHRTVESLRAQTHGAWELCLAARALSPWSIEAIERVPALDPRIRMVPAGGWGAALRAGTGALICALTPGDQLPPTALQQVVAVLADEPGAGLVFTDEDVSDASGRHSPRLKPAFSPLDPDAIGQLAVYRSDLLDGYRPDADEPDPVRAACRYAASQLGLHQIVHLPVVLCHRARPPAPLPRDAPRGLSGAERPLVTVIVPTKDHPDVLATCLRGLRERTAYAPTEILVVDNGSTDPDTLAALDALEDAPGVRVLRDPGPFNFARLNNAAAAAAREGVLLLLNDDVEVLHPEWLDEMVGQLMRPGVGIVGAKLLYPNRTVQHAGLLLGPGGAATHVGRFAAADDPGYLGQLDRARDLSAVTGACLAISTETWRRVGGMDERLAVTWNDVDLCLRVRRAGLRVVWTPHATLKHRESVSRGLESADIAKLARFRAEQALAVATWGEALERDPFLHPSLEVLESGGMVLARPRDRRPITTFPFASTP